MSLSFLSSVPQPVGDVLAEASSAAANASTSIFASRMASFVRETGLNRISVYCRSPTAFVGRLLACLAGQSVVSVVEASWNCSDDFVNFVFGKYMGYSLLLAMTGFLVWCSYTCWLQFQVDCPSSYFSLLPTANPISYILGTRLHLTVGMEWFWDGKFDKYIRAGSDLIAIRTFFHRRIEYVVAGVDAFKVISRDKVTFDKATGMYFVLNFFGVNLVTAPSGDEHKAHRDIVKPSFQSSVYPLVWNRTLDITREMMDGEGWNAHKSGDRFTISHIHNLTSKVALAVIAQAGFGLNMSWADHNAGVPESGSTLKGEADHKASLARWGRWAFDKSSMSVQQALRIVATYSILRAACPKVFFWFPTAKMWAIDRAFTNLERYLKDMVEERSQKIRNDTDFEEVEHGDRFGSFGEVKEKVKSSNLFDSLVRSWLASDVLSIREVIGNVYIFLLAGHETTANSLAFTFALLALNPEAQEKVYREVMDVCGDEAPQYKHYHLLKYTLAAYNESIRLFPPVNIIPKVAKKDTTLDCRDLETGESRKQVIAAKSLIMLDVVGLHRNPAYWPQPDQFRPERFINMSPKQGEAFFPFSGGSRRCIGRHFTEVESVCAMATLIQKYRMIPGKGAGESLAALEKQLLEAKQVITLTPVDCPITFERR